MTRKSIIGLQLMLLFIFSSEIIGQYCEDEYDVPYVPTKHEVVKEMLKIANVSRDDILYDLGCGDGRIVITAAKEFGTNGTGIDINPVRINESNENALKEGVTDKVRFIEQDLFEADIREATVLTLYLLQSVNLRLRPKIFRELKPGTRIVSHDFDMGEWEPDQSSKIYSNDNYDYHDSHTVYFWILPANISGTWEWQISASTEKKRYILHLDQKFQEVSGNLTTGEFNIPVMNIILTGERLLFTVEEKIGDQKVTHLFDGLVDENVIEGTVVSKAGMTSDKRNWNANRNPSTLVPVYDSDSY